MASYRFDGHLDRVRSDYLKSMMRLYGGASQMRKAECLATIHRALSDPARMRGTVASLAAWERNALALVKQMGGAVDHNALALALRASGVPLPRAHSPYSERASEIVRSLIRRGLFLSGYGSDPGYLHDYGGSIVFSDERLLAHVHAPEVIPFDLQPTALPASATFRRPPTVVLDLIGILQAINEMGGLQLTQEGTIRTNDARKLIRALGWSETQMEVDGFAFPDPAMAFAHALYHSGLLAAQGNAWVVSGSIDAFATRPYVEQVGAIWRGFVSARAWRESEARGWYEGQGAYRVQGRWALSLALAALPAEDDGFFSIDDLSQALFARIGEHFALDYPPHPPYYFRETPEEIRRQETERHAKLWADWLNKERPWIQQALVTWLYFLGIVEIGLENRTPVSVRLTDLGRGLFHPELGISLERPAPETPAAWIVQPNFDIVVYLDRAAPPQLAFLERIAERIKAQQHTAHYRLTREAVYRGLENNTALEELLSTLQAGAGAALPPNVVTEIREWSALREKVTLRRRARLLEFSDEYAREAALRAGIGGAPVGERFVLLDAGKVDPRWAVEIVDYAKPLEPCLSASEKGAIRFKRPPRDLLIESQLERWAERRADGKWQLTAMSVAAAMRAGARVSDLFAFLQERLTHTLPPLLGVALRTWAGERLAVEVATVAVLRCPEPDVFEAVVKSPALKPYLRGQLAPDALLVDAAQMEALREELAWAGLRVAEELIVKWKEV